MDVYINDSFYEKAYQWLKPNLQGKKLSSIIISRTDKRGIIEKLWRVTTDDGKILDKQNRVMWFRELFTILASSHSAIVHWGWDKTEDYVKKRFSGITQKVILKHVHINVQPTPTTKKCYSTTKRNRLTIQFRQIFHKPCWNSLNRFQKLGMSM